MQFALEFASRVARMFSLGVLALAAWTAPAAAQSVETFYKSRPLNVVIGLSPGAGYDLYARTVGRHIGKHLPGTPSVVPQNMPGAGSLKAINYLYNIAPKDGSVIATFSRGVPMEPLFGNADAKFDPLKLNWIGSPSQETNVFFSWKDGPFKSFADLQSREMYVAGSGYGADIATFTLLANEIFGTKFKLVMGYPGATEMFLAMERGEVQGIAGLSIGSIRTSKPDWLRDGKITLLAQLALEKNKDLPGVPFAMDFVKAEADRDLLELFLSRLVMAWPLAAPPEVPADRVAALRQAFDATMKDEGFLADASKQNMDVNPVKGADMASLLARIYQSPRDVVERAQAIVLGGR